MTERGGMRRAVIIGVSEYQDAALNSLDAPRSDIASLAEVLSDANKGRFDRVEVLQDVAIDPLRRQLARFLRDTERDDLLMVYFSGHGLLDDAGRLFLAASDTEREFASSTALPAAFLTEELERCSAAQQLLVLDCCHSGAFARGAKGVVGDTVDTGARFRPIGKGRFVLTATDATQYAWEGERVSGTPMPSVFTAHLIEGLSTGAADLNGDGEITVDELYDYVHRRVAQATNKQTPKKWSFNQQGEVVVAWVAQNSVAAAPLPEHVLDALRSFHPQVRFEVVDQLRQLARGRHRGLALSAVDELTRLLEDDSRRVSAAAAEALADIGAMPSVAAPAPVPAETAPVDVELPASVPLEVAPLPALLLAPKLEQLVPTADLHQPSLELLPPPEAPVPDIRPPRTGQSPGRRDACVAVLLVSMFLPWATVRYGGYSSVNGLNNVGWLIGVMAVLMGAVVLLERAERLRPRPTLLLVGFAAATAVAVWIALVLAWWFFHAHGVNSYLIRLRTVVPSWGLVLGSAAALAGTVLSIPPGAAQRWSTRSRVSIAAAGCAAIAAVAVFTPWSYDDYENYYGFGYRYVGAPPAIIAVVVALAAVVAVRRGRAPWLLASIIGFVSLIGVGLFAVANITKLSRQAYDGGYAEDIHIYAGLVVFVIVSIAGLVLSFAALRRGKSVPPSS